MIERMKFLNITGPKDDIDRVIETYISKYDFQIENALSELKDVKELHPFTDTNPYKNVLSISQELKEYFKNVDFKSNRQMSIEEAEELTKTLYDKVNAFSQKKSDFEAELAKYEEKLKNVQYFIGLDYDTEKILHFKYVNFRFGSMPKEYYEKFMTFIYDSIDTIFYKASEIDDRVWGVYFVPEAISDQIDAIYSSMHFERFFLPEGYEGTPAAASKHLEEKIQSINNEIASVDSKIVKTLEDRRDDFLLANHVLNRFNRVFDVRKYAAATRENRSDKRVFYIICGWLTEKDAAKLSKELEDEPNTFCLSEKDLSKVLSTPPVRLKNNVLFRPFEMFVEMYGLPNYREFDPTVLVGITYSILFGFMFGDVGQGLVLLILGSIFACTKKLRLAGIIARCGFFSTIFGFLFGSVFGFEDIIQPLWLRPAKAMTALPVIGNLNTVFVVTITLGMAVIILMMILNILTKLRFKKPGEALFDTNGVAGLVFYASALATMVLFMAGYELPASIVLIIMFVIPLILIFLKEPLAKMVEKEHVHLEGGVGMFILQGFFELFEVLLSYFSNSLSFVRVGAFAVSHAAMMEVVLMLSGAESGHINWIGVVLGNIFVMGMEGLIVGIQVLRLEYYELFSRFYTGGGRAFKPYS
ncbi:V-type ATP synthase subunit I [Lachnoanaerobaculum saburreum]|uniref:V-type ATPase 116kDa subunit family protein n=1 Tax=Lachnoanaerobaculum saburreum DSM 3986 TaxID=887325 RepID=E6LSD6_9FIRM|nr:V-type ATPase 116kDa subunit family protein [Lachnoanaerobaculum saburreum]EFU75233.1 V-type ATPase 116kDa subunit family protein [Lachnoanaerobaculum saburreum DSM 3986]